MLDMATQAKAHFEEGYAKGYVRKPGDTSVPGLEDVKLGSWLMQDMGELLRGRPQFAYPPELWRWG
jgi:hypothetical protein